MQQQRLRYPRNIRVKLDVKMMIMILKPAWSMYLKYNEVKCRIMIIVTQVLVPQLLSADSISKSNILKNGPPAFTQPKLKKSMAKEQKAS